MQLSFSSNDDLRVAHRAHPLLAVESSLAERTDVVRFRTGIPCTDRICKLHLFHLTLGFHFQWYYYALVNAPYNG